MTASYAVCDVFDGLATLEDGSIDLVVTSPPFLALRSYLPADHPDKDKEIGSEKTPAEFLDVMLRFTAELRRVLAPHGSIAIELGDTYAGSGAAGGDYLNAGLRDGQPPFDGSDIRGRAQTRDYDGGASNRWDFAKPGTNSRLAAGAGWPLTKSKTLIPELYRIALAYGINPLTGEPSPAGQWRVRNVVTWCRPNPPVGALGDKWRPATSDVVVACVSSKRFWDDLATRKPYQHPNHPQIGKSSHGGKEATGEKDGNWQTFPERAEHPSGAPLLDYWEIPPTGYSGSHYAVFPPELVVPLVKAMCPEKVCRMCGEPSRRIVNVEYEDSNGHRPGKRRDLSEPEGNTRGIFGQQKEKVGTTSIWSDCGHDNWRPGIVLDPFAGSGTTLAVAHGHGHDSIGFDLDHRNVTLARERVGPMFFEEVNGEPQQDPPEIRFWKFVEKGNPDECWLWIGGLQGSGYGQFSLAHNKFTGAHRFSWQLANGRPVPPGLQVMHACDVRRCVNPAHLSVGTCSENHWDRSRKGRNPGNPTSRGGVPRTLDVDQIRTLREAGLTYVQIGKALGVSGPTVWRNFNT